MFPLNSRTQSTAALRQFQWQTIVFVTHNFETRNDMYGDKILGQPILLWIGNRGFLLEENLNQLNVLTIMGQPKWTGVWPAVEGLGQTRSLQEHQDAESAAVASTIEPCAQPFARQQARFQHSRPACIHCKWISRHSSNTRKLEHGARANFEDCRKHRQQIGNWRNKATNRMKSITSAKTEMILERYWLFGPRRNGSDLQGIK